MLLRKMKMHTWEQPWEKIVNCRFFSQREVKTLVTDEYFFVPFLLTDCQK